MKQYLNLIASLAVLIFVLGASFYFAEFTANNEAVRELVNTYGYVGAYVTATLLGLSAVAPVPSAIFMPVFTSAELLPVFVIIALSLGTLTADVCGYYLGHLNTNLITSRYPRLHAWFQRLYTERYLVFMLAVFLYVAFVPLPNELVVISLGVLGASLRPLIVPLFLGSVIHHTIFAFGTQTLYGLLF